MNRIAIGLLALVPSVAAAMHLPLPAPLVGLDTPEGARYLSAATASADFYALVDTFVTQQDQSYCAIASTVTILNALPVAAPAPAGFTQGNLFTDEARRLGVAHGGLTVEQVTALLRTLPTEPRPTYASDATLDGFRQTARRVLSTGNRFLLVNFLRSALGQEPKDGLAGKLSGHWSPLAAYDEADDRVLVLDVNRGKYPPTWVPTPLLFEAMRTVDPDSGKSRGFIEVAAAAGASPPAFKPGTSRLLLFAGGIVLSIFLVGVALGFLVGRRRARRAAAVG